MFRVCGHGPSSPPEPTGSSGSVVKGQFDKHLFGDSWNK